LVLSIHQELDTWKDFFPSNVSAAEQLDERIKQFFGGNTPPSLVDFFTKRNHVKGRNHDEA
jgi:hypothetical protein